MQAQEIHTERIPAYVEPEIYVQVPLRKYRVGSYDIHDETYAKEMSKYSLPEECHIFTQRLMDEPRINRYALLQAIDEYKQAGLPTLSAMFQNAAFNYRPGQGCVIC